MNRIAKWRFEIVPHGDAGWRADQGWPVEKVLVFRDDELIAQVFATEGVRGLQVASDRLDLNDPMNVQTAKEFNEIVASVGRTGRINDERFVPWVAYHLKGEIALSRDGSRR